MLKGVFITGTNTGVGKTWIGTRLVHYFNNHGINVTPQKPIESGCVIKDGNLFAEDAQQYYLSNKRLLPESQITPFKFSQICSPARASKLSKTQLTLEKIVQHIKANQSDQSILIVEGAGGILSPLTQDALNIDLVVSLGLPFILIADDDLGCINSILLTLNVCKQKKLSCIAIILNKINHQEHADLDNKEELKEYTDIAIIKNDFENNNAIEQLALLLQK